MPEDDWGDIEQLEWQLEHPEERLPGVCRKLEKLRTVSSIGIVASVLVGLAFPAAFLFAPIFVYLRYHLPGCLRTLVSSINALRTRDLPERLERGMVISVFAYKHREMPDWGNVLLAEVVGAGDVEMASDYLLNRMSATPVLANEADHERGTRRSQTIGVVRVLSEPIWEREKLIEGEVEQGDLGHFFVEGDRALLAGKATTEE